MRLPDLKPANAAEPRRMSACVYIVTADDIKQKEIAPDNKPGHLQNGQVHAAPPPITSKVDHFQG